VPAPGGDALVQRLVWGALAAGAIALAARRSRTLSLDGAGAAVVVGTVSAAAGWDWAAALITFFLTGSLWSRAGRTRKDARTAGVVAKTDERDAWQVLANGGVFALCAVGYAIWLARRGIFQAWPESFWHAGASGAIAAATGDTWATEVGTLWGGAPRSILTGRRVEPGMSGGVTVVGTLAGVAGAALIGAVVACFGWGQAAAAAALAGGVGGMGVDSLLGASVQQRRWCERCQVMTERAVHNCQTTTRRAGGLAWLDNDGVNALSTAAGAGIAWVAYRSLS
jgi:uncharacterized protein (TIGR00297 family)